MLAELITPQAVLICGFLAFGYLVRAAVRSDAGRKAQGAAAKSFLEWVVGKLK